jgi:serine/threonine-protein phosphatase 2A regulatory subunit B
VQVAAMISGASGAAAAGSPPGGAAAAAVAPLPPLEWKFSQVFGERAIGEEVQEGMWLDRRRLMD